MSMICTFPWGIWMYHIPPRTIPFAQYKEQAESGTEHGNQFSKIINSEMVILTPITINNHFNNANYVTKVDHLCSERHTFNFLLKKVDFRDVEQMLVDGERTVTRNNG